MKLDTHNPLTVVATVAFIQEAHQGQTYDNMPYFFHPVEVAQEVENVITAMVVTSMPVARITLAASATLVALLHDVVEDTNYTEADLRERFADDIVDAVMLLTLKEGKDYRDNIQRIVDSGNILAMVVKLADNRVNRRGDKASFSPAKAKKLNDRYDMSMEMLTAALGLTGVEINA
jgi:(p)ppGpp synthase/HD superfamily hydrolase